MGSPKQAADLLAKEQWQLAMDALLSAWRRHRTPELEAAIASLSDCLSESLPAIDVDQDDWQTQWERRAQDTRSVELGVLLPHVTRAPKGAVPRRLQAVLGFGPDPRVGELLLAIIEDPPTTASSNFSMWSELFRVLPEYVDDRATDQLNARAANRGGKSQFWDKLDKWIATAVAKLPPPASLPPQWLAELAELDEQIAALTKLPAPQLESSPVDHQAWPEVDDLDPARAALDAGDLDGALDLLVGYWGQRRHPIIAALIDRLGLMVDGDQQGPTAKTQRARHAAWIEAAQRPRPRAVGPLLASLRDAKLADVEARIETMVGWRPDPRVAQAMLAVTQDVMLGARDGLWRATYDALVHHADPRVAAQVRDRHARLADAHVAHRHRSEGRQIRRVFAAFCEAASEPKSLTNVEDGHAEVIAASLEARLAAESDDSDADLERALVEAIVADWDDDGPRLVYSDWLQCRQDPRGEFIALDIALAQGKKVKGAREKWFKAHKDALFGPLAGILGWRHRFDRGLLTDVQITTRNGGMNVAQDQRLAMLTDLRWATLRSLDVSGRDDVAELLERAPLLGLERLSQPSLSAALGLARRDDAIPLTSLNLAGNVSDPDADWARLSELCRVLPKLETLAIMIWGREGDRVTPPLAWFQSELVRRVKLLSNGGKGLAGISRVDEWLERMAASACPVPLVRMIGPELSAQIHQRELGRFAIDLRLDNLRNPETDSVQAVLATLRQVDRQRVASMSVVPGVIADAVRPELDAALAGLRVEWLAPASPLD